VNAVSSENEWEIFGYAFDDKNKNGVRDEGEQGIFNVTISLLDEQYNPINTTATDEDGNYTFGLKPSGEYIIKARTREPQRNLNTTDAMQYSVITDDDLVINFGFYRLAILSLHKNTYPYGDPGTFNFTIQQNGEQEQIHLESWDFHTFYANEGTCEISEIVPSGYVLTKIVIIEYGSKNSVVDLSSNLARVEVDYNEDVYVEYLNERTPDFVIPEYPLGTVLAIAACVIALLLAYWKPR
jgi:hypothetical protein